MKSTVSIVLTILLFTGLFISADAQPIKQFSEDHSKFAEEVQVYFSNITSPTVGIRVRELLNPFVAAWETNVYNDKERAMIVANANLLLERKVSNYPDFFNYISIIQGLKQRGNRQAIEFWSQDLNKKATELNLRNLQAYIEQYRAFVSDRILVQSSSFNWLVSDTSIHLEYDTAIRVIFKKTDLECASRKDTSRIYGTSGVFLPDAQTWEGRKGRTTWERVGLSSDSVYADLSAYQVNMKFSEYKADSVRLINKKYFREPIFGELNEKVLSSPPGPTSSYPQFSSYLKNYEIKNLYKGIDYRGGFSFEGARVIGSGEVNENASLYIRRDEKLLAQIRSNAFRIQDDQISANPASLSIITDGDSVYHPGLQLKYFDDKRQLIMFRAETGISQSPFFNGYHNIDMNCGAMYWNLDQDTVNFESVPSVNRTSTTEFISKNFFSKYEFYKIQGIDDKNPLYIIRDYSRAYGTNEITPAYLAQFMNKSIEQVKAMMLRLSIQGLLYYDLVNDKAIIQDRLNRYIESSAGKKDYDVIKIQSVTNNISNASLNLKNNDLVIRGVEQVFLSDSQQVYIFPENREIVMKKGLDFLFTGLVKAGLFDFYAHECSFEYDSFRLNMPMIDSLSFQVKSFEKDDRGLSFLRKVNSVIEDLSGQLLIDHPSNKSGLQSFPAFPIFISEQESFVYYDRDPRYDRERFAYHIYAFVIDSLDNFSTDNLQFDGYLVSDSIFPNIRQPLKVQPDYSLGFVNQSPAKGYPVYGGTGKYFEEVTLSNRGLRGKGRIDFLTSTTVSDDFHFYPDQSIARLVNNYTIKPLVSKIEYPEVMADSVYQVWYPYRDTMHVKTLARKAELFESKASLTGDLYYSSTGLSGSGQVEFEDVELSSGRYLFKHHTVDADTLDFRLKNRETGELVVSAEKYRTHVDFDTRIVEFKTNQLGSTVSFPYNNFVCFMDNIDWYMDKKEMKLFNDLGEKYAGIDQMSEADLLKLDLTGSDFMATNPQMDSLSFFSVTARYDLMEYIIDAEDVKLIRVADAAIFPENGHVRILQGGQLQPLINTVILADTANQFHRIENAEVNISSIHHFEGKGDYQYRFKEGKIQEFPLNEIGVDSAGRTFAIGLITEEAQFQLSPFFGFRGNVLMNSARRDLYLEGGFQTTDDCDRNKPKQWVYFRSWIDPDELRIPVQPPLVSLDGMKLDLGILVSDYEEEVYFAWFDTRSNAWDTVMVTGTGDVFYDQDAGGYRVSGRPAGFEVPVPGELFFDTEKCRVESSGPIELGLPFNYVTLNTFGDLSYLIIPDSAQFRASLSFDFHFSEPSLNVMADSMLRADLQGIDITGKSYQSFLEYTLGALRADELKTEVGLYGNFRRMPDELIHSLLLTDVNLYWNDQTNSYISLGPIGVLSIGKNAINRYVNGTIELIRRRSGNVMTVYLELSPMQWYFFDYRAGIMQAIASDMTFNNRIESVKQEKRMQSKPGLDETYEYVISSRRRLIDFLRRIESATQ